ncbi:MAG: NADH-quinone oxidoreductase subunit NuoE [Candidatus Cloacimonadota bacterium]|nr:NADH-quinone oxidoreductase subunit NuoE [Candidatus Cloacimonadota bacterium]
MTDNDVAKIDEVLEQYKDRAGSLIPILQSIQTKLGYLSKETIKYISKNTKIPVSEIYGVVTFYTQFRLQPIGKNIIRICHGTACHVANVLKIADTIFDELNVKPGGTTDDLKFTVEVVACLGCCSLAPVMMINDKAYGRLTSEKVKKILTEY